MKPVSRDRFLRTVGGLNVHPSPQGEYPYTSLWKMIRTGRVVGKTVGTIPEGKALPVTTYFVDEEALRKELASA